jgi:hypothetical protein
MAVQSVLAVDELELLLLVGQSVQAAEPLEVLN